MFAEEPLGHEVQLAFQRLAVVRSQLLRGMQSAYLDVGKRGQGVAIELVDAAPGPEQRQVLRVAQIFHDDEAAPRIRGVHVWHVRAGLLQQRRYLEIRRDIFLAGWRVHDDECVGLRRPARRVDVAARDTEVTPEAGISGCHADATDAPFQVACQPCPNECEARVVLEHSYKYSAQHCARDFDQGCALRPRTCDAAHARSGAGRRAAVSARQSASGGFATRRKARGAHRPDQTSHRHHRRQGGVPGKWHSGAVGQRGHAARRAQDPRRPPGAESAGSQRKARGWGRILRARIS